MYLLEFNRNSLRNGHLQPLSGICISLLFIYYLEFMLTKHWIYPQVTAPVDIKVYRLTETCLHRFSAHQTVQVWTWEQNTFFLWHVKGWTEIKMAKRQGQASCVVSGRALARPRRRRQHNTSQLQTKAIRRLVITETWNWVRDAIIIRDGQL